MSQSQFCMKTQHRGLLVTITFAVMRHSDNFDKITSDPVVINNMAEVILKLRAVKVPEHHMKLMIKFKKNKSFKEGVLINIMVDDFNKRFLCHNEWLEVSIDKKINCTALLSASKVTVLYQKQINISVSSFLPKTLCLSGELNKETDSMDFKLQGTDGSVPVHKSVLWVHSDMFRTMFRGDWKETDEDSIDMPGVSAQTLQHLKDYMYLDRVPDDGLESLLLLARRCLMHQLTASCIEKLIKSVKPETFDALVELACQNNIPELMKGLVMRIPDEVITGIANLNIDKKKSNDTK